MLSGTPPDGAAQMSPAGVATRADLRLWHERLRAAERVVRDGWTDYAPSLVATFQPFVQAPPTVLLPRWGWQVQLALAWTLFDGGFRQGAQRERRVRAHEAEAELRGSERQALSEVRSAEEGQRRAAAALAAARSAQRLAASGLELANLAYRGGASTNIEVVDAERRARDADTVVGQAEDALRQAALDLLVATGRFPAEP